MLDTIACRCSNIVLRIKIKELLANFSSPIFTYTSTTPFCLKDQIKHTHHGFQFISATKKEALLQIQRRSEEKMSSETDSKWLFFEKNVNYNGEKIAVYSVLKKAVEGPMMMMRKRWI